MLAVVTLLGASAHLEGLTINATFDATITSDPQSAKIQATINSAIAAFQDKFSDPITVSIKFQKVSTGLGASSTLAKAVQYSDYRAALVTHATTQDDATALASLPSSANNPVNNNAKVNLDFPLARALGFTAVPPPIGPLSPVDPSVSIKVGIMNPTSGDTAAAMEAFRAARAHDLQLPGSGARSSSPNGATAQPDGVISLKTSIMNLSPTDPVDTAKYSLFAVVCHEIDEVLGTGSALDGLNNGDPSPTGPVYAEDLFRYDQNGSRSFTTTFKAPPIPPAPAVEITSYFSLDGTTLLARFNQDEAGDFGDWWSPGKQTPQVQDAFGTAGAAPVLGVELRVLDAVGYNPVPAQVYVDFAYAGLPNLGTYNNPYPTLAAGRDNVLSAGVVILKGPRSSPEVLTLSKPMTLQAISGPVTIGN